MVERFLLRAVLALEQATAARSVSRRARAVRRVATGAILRFKAELEVAEALVDRCVCLPDREERQGLVAPFLWSPGLEALRVAQVVGSESRRVRVRAVTLRVVPSPSLVVPALDRVLAEQLRSLEASPVQEALQRSSSSRTQAHLRVRSESLPATTELVAVQ
jgi:hypothetical protein